MGHSRSRRVVWMDSGGFIHTTREDLHPRGRPTGWMVVIVTDDPTTRQNDSVTLKKFQLDLDSPDEADAFVFVDLDGAERATGVVRSAKKILVDGARSLARSETYAWALMERRYSGASAGINATDPVRRAAIEAFNDRVGTELEGIDLRLRPGKGVATTGDPLRDGLLAHGVVAATAVALDGLDSRSVALEAGSPAVDEISRLLTERGASVESVTLDELTSSTADALVCGSRVGVIDHDTAALLDHAAIIPSAPSPLTARAFAVMRRRGTTVMAGFLTACGPLFVDSEQMSADTTPPADPSTTAELVEEFVTRRCREFADHSDGPFMAACYAAEAFMSTWLDELPFGRPLG